MIVWRADVNNLCIRKIEDVISITDILVTIHGHSGTYMEDTFGYGRGHFRTWEEAHKWLCSKVGNKVSAMNKEYIELINKYEEILNLTDPQEDIEDGGDIK